MTLRRVSSLDDDLITEEVAAEPVVRVAEADLPTQSGTFRIAVFQVQGSPTEIVALLHGDHERVDAPVVRLHSECLTGDVLGSLRCDCGEQLEAALEQISIEGCGILLYLRQEGRGIGLANKIRAYALQDEGLDTVDANLALGLPVDGRDYGAAAEVLRFLGVRKVRLLTNNPAKSAALQTLGIDVSECIPLLIAPNPANLGYLRTKAARMGHTLSSLGQDEQEGAET